MKCSPFWLCLCLALLSLSACSESTSPDQWAGNWLRTDGTYRLEITVSESGTPQAGYFNPNPIHVEKAEFNMNDGTTRLVVTLNDFNYPNAIYSLAYHPETDRLEGSYYNPRAGRPFPVAFKRVAN